MQSGAPSKFLAIGCRRASPNVVNVDDSALQIERENKAPRADAAPEEALVLAAERSDVAGKRFPLHVIERSIYSFSIAHSHAP
jgi:hypothetical protein